MKSIAAALALLFAAPAVFAQYPYEAKDLRDVQRLISDVQQQIKPALIDVRQTADTLAMLVSVHQTLVEDPPLTAVDKSLQRMADFIERAEKMNQPLSRENLRSITLVKNILNDTKMGPQPPELLPVREKIHHEYLTEMQRRVMANQLTLLNLQQMVDGLQLQLKEPLVRSGSAMSTSVSGQRQ